jgi:hypothetical protein
MTLLIIIIVLVILFGGGGHFYNGGAYRAGGFGIAGVLIVLHPKAAECWCTALIFMDREPSAFDNKSQRFLRTTVSSVSRNGRES